MCDNYLEFYWGDRAKHSIFLTAVFCKGYEDQLIHCTHDFGDNVCTRSQDVILYCGMSMYLYSYKL